MDSRKALLSLALLLSACAGGRKAPSPFVLVEGKKIGTLEVVAEESDGWTQKKRDSLAFDNQYLRTKPRIGFKYPGEEITLMKVYEGEKLLKSCDEGEYSREINKGGWTGGNMVMGANGKMMMTPGSYKQDTQEFKQTYNLVCDVTALADGMTVELHDHEGLVSKYKVVTAAP